MTEGAERPPDRWLELDRRAFLRVAVSGAGALVLGSCRGGGSSPTGAVPTTTLPPVVPADQLPPAPRPTVRLPNIFAEGVFFPNPFAYFPPGYIQISLIYDTLMMVDEADGSLLPWLADSYEVSADGLTHTFVLRDGVHFHDGRPLTAEDVAFSFEYYKAKLATGKVAPANLFAPQHVVGARARSKLVADVYLDKPVVSFVKGVGAYFPIVPRHVWAPIDKPADVREKNAAALVGTGPFRWSKGSDGGALLIANDSYFLGRPFVSRIEGHRVSDEVVALRADKIDVGGSSGQPSSVRELERFGQDPRFGLLSGELDFPTAIFWNLKQGGALADVAFRRAMAYAIDRPELVRRLLGTNGAPGNPGYLPPGHPFHVPVEQYPHDLERANRLLDGAGYRRGRKGIRAQPNGKPLRPKLVFLTALAQVVEIIKPDLDDLGLDIELDPIDTSSLFFDLRDDYDMALIFFGGVSGDTDIMRGQYSSRGRGTGPSVAHGYVNAELDDLAERQLVTADLAERRRIVARMQHIAAADIPFLILFYRKTLQVVRRSVFDVHAARPGTDPTSKRAMVTGMATGATIRPLL